MQTTVSLAYRRMLSTAHDCKALALTSNRILKWSTRKSDLEMGGVTLSPSIPDSSHTTGQGEEHHQNGGLSLHAQLQRTIRSFCTSSLAIHAVSRIHTPGTMTAFITPVLPFRGAINRIQTSTRHACYTAKRRVVMRLPACETLEKTTRDWGLSIDSTDDYGNGITALSRDPPLLRIESFLTHAQCDDIIAAQEKNAQECDLYLNYRVNQEVASGVSNEAAELIESSGVSGISASSRSGFRAQIDPSEAALQPVLHGIRKLLGFGEREFVFEEGAWVRPNRRRVVVRDQTTVRYEVGEGVAPHVDGKDVTVLICLEEPVAGGRTVFPDEGIAVVPKKGCALVYRSCGELVHFAEAVAKGRKWVLQLLVDFRIRRDELDVDFSSGTVYNN